MDRIERLERSWFIYKVKQIVRKAIFFTMAIALGAGAVYYARSGGGWTPDEETAKNPLLAGSKEDDSRGEVKVANVAPIPSSPEMSAPTPEILPEPFPVTEIPPPEQTQVVQQTQQVQPQNPPLSQTVQRVEVISPKPKMHIAPSFSFEDDLGRRVRRADGVETAAVNPAITRSGSGAPLYTPVAPSPEMPVESPEEIRVEAVPAQIVNPPEKTGRLVMTKVSGLKDLEQAYQKQPTYSKAVDIAREYLRSGNNQEAYDWAKKANELNSGDERSWAIFAASSYRMGKKDDATKALKIYLEKRKSDRISRLLRQIEAGEANVGGDL
ncbi:MAG: CDC27 family protein [Helicobacteraceae bacterium]|jgi:hypothetical protein|nr:CDC27 family protein [Helicobacteraceae bacterium]